MQGAASQSRRLVFWAWPREYLVFDETSSKSRRVSKEDTIEDVLKLLDF